MRLAPTHLMTLSALTTALLLAGCGGSSSTSTSTSNITVSGTAVAGPVNGTVRVQDAAGNQLGLAAVTSGQFSLELNPTDCIKELDFEVIGQYTDEVSGQTVQLSAQTPLAARIAPGSCGVGTANSVGITPQTTVIREMVTTGGLTLTQAQTLFQNTFGSLPDSGARAFDPTQTAPAGADAAQQREAFMVGAYSQWGNDLGLVGNQLASLPVQLAVDLADGALDGLGANGNPVALGNTTLQALQQQNALLARYLTAMARFAGSDANKNGAALTAPTDGLPTSGVSEPLTPAVHATRSLTLGNGSTLDVAIWVDNPAPLGDLPLVARNRHMVELSSGGVPVDITAWGGSAALTAAMQMHMLDGKSHSTPYNPNYIAADSDPANGLYAFDIYYLMASSMLQGGVPSPMGVWDLGLTLTEADGTAHPLMFHPEVKMAMDGSVLRVKGASPDDAPMMNGQTMPRPYFLWLHGVSDNAGGGYDLSLALSARKTMQSFPLIKSGLALGVNMMTMAPMAPYVEGVTLHIDSDGNGSYDLALDGSANDGTFSTNGLALSADGDGFLNLNAEVVVTLGSDNDPATTADQTAVTLSGLALQFKQP